MEQAVSFGYKMTWLAVRVSEPERVLDPLGIEQGRPVSWEEGIESIHSGSHLEAPSVFVTPELDGWVLVASSAYFDVVSDAEPDRLSRFVGDTAAQLHTEVQLFATHRVVEGHAWAMGDARGIRRAYFYLGEVDECLLDVGEKTRAEEALKCFAPGSTTVPDESTVMQVARAWSVDPTELAERFPQVAPGYLGTIARATSGDAEIETEEEPQRPWWRFW